MENSIAARQCRERSDGHMCGSPRHAWMILAHGGAGPRPAWQRVEDAQICSRWSRYELGRAQGTSTRERSAVRSPERLRARVAHAQAVSRYPKSGRNSMPHSENPDLSLRCARQRAALGFRAPQAEKNCPKGPKTRFPYQKRDNFLASSRRRRRKIVRKRSLRRRLSSDVQLRAWRPAAAR